MQNWQINLGFTDSALLFLHTMGFVQDKNWLDFDDLLDYYGRSSSSTEVFYEDRNEIVVTFSFCETYDVQFRAILQEKRPYSPADLMVDLKKSESTRMLLATDTNRKLPFTQWSRKYRCNEFGGVELCAEQVAQIVRILSGLRESYREWRYYIDG